MNRIFKLEIKRAFRNRLFAATLCVAFANMCMAVLW